MIKILIIEDEPTINQGLTAFLRDQGYQVFSTLTGEQGIQIFGQEDIDLVILDIMLPGINGIDVLKSIKSHCKTPVIMLTALEDEASQVQSFDQECDDYICKPFSLVLLNKRVEAVLRRSQSLNTHAWQYRQAKVDFDAFEATYGDQPINITPKEIEILAYLLENTGRVLSRSQILDRVWDDTEDTPYDRTIDVYIKNLRKKLKLDCIQTVKGIGYKLTLEEYHDR